MTEKTHILPPILAVTEAVGIGTGRTAYYDSRYARIEERRGGNIAHDFLARSTKPELGDHGWYDYEGEELYGWWHEENELIPFDEAPENVKQELLDRDGTES